MFPSWLCDVRTISIFILFSCILRDAQSRIESGDASYLTSGRVEHTLDRERKRVQGGRRALPVKRYEGMVPIPRRRFGSIWPAGSRRERHEKLVRAAEGLEPSRTLRSNGFSCHYGFRRPRLILRQQGLGSGLSLRHAPNHFRD